MNKGELVDHVAFALKANQNAAVTKKQVAAVIDMVLDSIGEVLADGEKVTLVGFGTFESRSREARVARNPQTGEPIAVPARKTPVFSAGKGLKEVVNGG